MKKITKKIIFTCIITAFIVGCGINNSESIIKKIDSKYNKANSYYAEGTMEILNNENTYTYNVKVSYNITHSKASIPVSLTIARVEGGA